MLLYGLSDRVLRVGVGNLRNWTVSRTVVMVDRFGSATGEQLARLHCWVVS